MLLKAPNGATVDARDDAVAALMANGFKRAEAVKPETKPKAAPRKRTAKPKE